MTSHPILTEPTEDPRSVDELLAVILGSDSEEDSYWDAVGAIRRSDAGVVFERASRLGESLCPRERQAAANILAQLGVRLGAEPVLSDKRLAVLLNMLAVECDDGVLNSILIALGHLKRAEAIGPILRHRDHADPDVRYAVVFGLLTHDDPQAIAALIELARDEATDVRDWATFGLGSMIDRDTPAIRQALVDRLDDADGTTRVEAMVGLARRRDPRVLPSLQADLAAGAAGPMELEAATLLGHPDLVPLLVALRGQQDVDQGSLEQAILASGSQPAVVAG